MKLQAFQAIAILHPEEQLQVKEKGVQEENSELIMTPVTVLASNQQQALVIAGRRIPEEHMRNMHRIEVIVRPF